jgi:hypothetical protein
MKDKWDVIVDYMYSSLTLMSGGVFFCIPVGIIYLVILWVFTSLGGEVGTNIKMGGLLAYPFSICLFTTYCQRESDATTSSERIKLVNQVQELYGARIEIEARVSKLVDRLEDEGLDPDDHNVDLDTVELMNDIRRELEDIQLILN